MPRDYGTLPTRNGNGNSNGSTQGIDERESLLPHTYDSERSSWRARVHAKLQEDINIEDSGPGLLCQCMIAGAADAAAYSQTLTWAAFMTGNLTQLIMAATTVTLTSPAPQEPLMRLASSASAVFGFVMGSFNAMLMDKRFGGKKRGKLVAWSLWRALVFFVMAPCVAYFGWKGLSGMVFLFVMAANMGSMAVNSTKLGSTPYATTVVFTATLAQLCSDPLLPFGLSSASRKRGYSIIGLLLGGALSQATMLGISRSFGVHSLSNALTVLAPTQPMPVGSAFVIGGVGLIEVAAAICWYRCRVAESS